MERALLSLVQRFSHAYYRQALDGLLCAPRRDGSSLVKTGRVCDTPASVTVADRYIDIETPSLSVRLDRRRGLALSSLHFASHAQPSLGGLPHGHFDDIHMQADWYTGDSVFEGVGEHKITDLELCDARIWTAEGDTYAFGASIRQRAQSKRRCESMPTHRVSISI